MDTVSDLAVFAFASWTVLYHLGLIFDLHTDPLLLVWVLTLPVLLWWLVRGRDDAPAADVADDAPPRRGWDRTNLGLAGAAVVLAAVSAALIFSTRPGVVPTTARLWWSGSILAAAAVGLGLVAALRAAARRPTAAPGRPVWLGAHLAVLAAGVGLAIFSVFIVRIDYDDIFYSNRAAWVADHGTIPTKDTIFTDQHFAAIRGAGVPVSSIETYQGAIAHVLHVSGGTATYIFTPPVAAFLAVWAMWRLIRRWAPRRYLLCLAVALTYLLWAGREGLNLGEFFLDRMEHGKSIFVSMMVPLLYLYLTRWAERPDRRNAVFLAVAGITAVGFSSSATFIVPLICGTAVVPLLLLRRYRVALGALLPFLYPLVVGLVVHFSYSAVDPNGDPYTMQQEIRGVFGPWWFGALGWVAAFCAFWLVRPVIARCAAGVAAVILLVLAIPPVLTLMTDLTGAHSVVWRSIWVVPIPILVGLLAAVPLPARVPVLGVVPGLALLAVVLLAGEPPIAAARFTTLSDKPTWRFPMDPVYEARAIIKADKGPGPVLAPSITMAALAISTTRIHAVDPLSTYVPLTDEPAADQQARLLLGDWVYGKHRPTVDEIRAAFTRLQVSMVCLRPEWTDARRRTVRAGYGDPVKVRDLVCYRPATS